MMKAPVLLIRLTLQGKPVADVRTDALERPILIGRAPEAAWRPSEDDRTMPARAAVLKPVDGSAVLVAERGRSFRLHGEVARERTLRIGDRIALGDCELKVEPVEERRLYAPYHRLEELDGARKGVFVDLRGEKLTIGSDRACGLRLADDTVSREHATISVREDGCWLRDAQSRNGTRVNGQRLGGKDRLLQDGDILSFGPFSYRFLDRTVPHVRANAVKNVLVALLTLLLAGGGWYAFYSRMPDASHYLIAAGDLAADTRFDEADALMDEARKARGFDANATLWRHQKERFATWRTTSSVWEEFKDDLVKGRLIAAAAAVGRLSLDRPDNWAWNEETLEARLSEVSNAIELARLDYAFWRARNDPELPKADLEFLTAQRRRSGVDAVDFVSDERPWMLALKRNLRQRVENFDANEAIYTRLTNALSRITLDNIPAVTADVESAGRNAVGHVRIFAHMLREPLAKLEADRQLLRKDAAALARLDEVAYSGRKLVTTPDDCAISAALGTCQASAVKQRRQLDLASLELRAMRKRLAVFGVVGTNEPSALVAFEDTNRVERALRCELLSAPRPPKASRTEPVDDGYDRLFGYEYLYSYMNEGYYAFPAEVDPDKLATGAFAPELRTLWTFAIELERDLQILRGEEFACVKTGPLATVEACFSDWIARIRALRKRFDAIADDPKTHLSRRGIVARAVHLYLTPHDEISKEDWADFRRRMVWLRENVRPKLDSLNPTKPEATKEVVDWIMANGIPGSPAVKKAWIYRK